MSIGVIAGALSAAFSMGGGILSKPGIRLLGVSPLAAVGTTLPMALPIVVTATVRYARQGLVAWSAVLWAAPGGIAGAVLGSWIVPRIPGEGHLLQIATALILLGTALRLGRDVTARPERRPSRERRPPGEGSAARLVVIGTCAGTLGGLLGIGGGLLLVPGFGHLTGMPLRISIPTSLVCAGIFAIPATVTHALIGTIDWYIALALSLGCVPGAWLGSRLTTWASDRRLQLWVAIVAAVIALSYAVGETAALVRAGR
jgi:uncharacterized membrane protein YfcA